MSSKLIYYVYAYLRSKDSITAKAGTPYYIGKGKGSRINDDHKYIPVPNSELHRVKLETNLSEIGAFAIERRIISWYGRKDIGTGILLNRADGGQGAAGYKHTAAAKSLIKKGNTGKLVSSETRQKLSELNKNRVVNNETRKKHSDRMIGRHAWNKGRHQTEEQLLANSLSHKGIQWSESRRLAQKPTWSDARREAQTGQPQKKLICPHCGKEGGTGNMKRFHFDNCKGRLL